MGTFTWLLAHWERDWKPLMTYLAVQLLVGYQLYVRESRIDDLWIATPERARVLSDIGSQWMIWTGLALGLWLAIRDRRERATGLEKASSRERVRRLISRSVAVTVLAALAQFPMLWFGWALHDMQQVGSWDRALGVFASSLSDVLFLLLFLLVTQLPVSALGALKLVVVLAAAWSPWLLIPGLALAAWSLFGAEHDPDTSVRPRRAWPCAIALLAFSLSVDSCSQRFYEDNRPGNGVLHQSVLEQLDRLVERGRLESTNFRMPDGWTPLWAGGIFGDSREVVVGDQSVRDNTYVRDRSFLRITGDGHLEAVRCQRGKWSVHRYPDPGGRPFGPEATIQRARQEPVISDPGRREFFIVRPDPEVWPWEFRAVALPDGDVLRGAGMRRSMLPIWPRGVADRSLGGDFRSLGGAFRVAGQDAAYTWSPESGWIDEETVERPAWIVERGPRTTREITVRMRSDDGAVLGEFKVPQGSDDITEGLLGTVFRPMWVPLLSLGFDQDTIPAADPWVRANPWGVLLPIGLTGLALGIVYVLLDKPWVDRRRRSFWMLAIVVGGPWVFAVFDAFEDPWGYREPPHGKRWAPRIVLSSSQPAPRSEVEACSS